MHEDLNTASRRRKTHKRYKLQVKSGSTATSDSKSGSAPEAADQNTDEAQQAADALDSYMKSNSSFVMDIFQVTIIYWCIWSSRVHWFCLLLCMVFGSCKIQNL